MINASVQRGAMDIQCEVCKTVFKVQNGLIPAGTKIRFMCKKCRPVSGSVDRSKLSKLSAPAVIGYPELNQPDPNRDRLTKERVLNSIRDLPAMPKVITEIQNQMTTADINTRKICDLIETDQAVATKVLRAANSAFYGHSGKVSTMHGALNLIGLKGLMEVVSLIGAHKLLVGKLPGYGYDAQDLWKHSLAVAYGSKLLALERDPGISDTAHLRRPDPRCRQDNPGQIHRREKDRDRGLHGKEQKTFWMEKPSSSA